MEQRSRNQCLLIHGVDETADENTDEAAIEVFNEKLGFNLNLDDIQRSHRLGPKRNARESRSKKK